MPSIKSLTFDFAGRDLTAFTRNHQKLLAAPLDDLPLADGHAVLIDLVRSGGSQPFACRIPDDPKLLTVWHSSGSAAVVSTYWRRKLAHVDLVMANAESTLNVDSVDGLPITTAEIESVKTSRRPLLVFAASAAMFLQSRK